MYKFLYCTLLFVFSASVFAQTPIFSPGLTVFGGYNDGTDFVEGMAGCCSQNEWLANEMPENAINGVGQKYLNFIELNAGLVVSTGLVSHCICAVQIWTANDAEERDPTSIEIYGSNTVFPGGSLGMTNYSLIFSSALNLPSTRNLGGNTPLDDNNSEVLNFPQGTTCYSNFLITFPTVKNSAIANSMQIAEVQLFTCTDCVPNMPIKVN